MQPQEKKGSNRSGTGKKAGKKGPYWFSPETKQVLDRERNATAYLEEAVTEKEMYATGGMSAHLDYIFKRVQPLQWEPTPTPAQQQELDMLNRWWEEARRLL